MGSLVMITAPAFATTHTAPLLTVTCTSTVSYGDDMTCWAASTDANGDFAEAGTFTFDAAKTLPATWSPARTCAVNNSQCTVDATLAAPANAKARTVTFVVSFKGVDGAVVTTNVAVDVTLRPTVTALACDTINLPVGGSTHCLVGVADQLYEWDSKPAQLGAGSIGLTVASSAPGDTIVFDKPAKDGASCVPAVANALLSCGFTLTADQTPGLRALTANYPGDPAADEQPSTTVLKVANGPRVAPTVTLTCPDTVPALAPTATCQVTVAGAPGVLAPSGQVALDQDFGQAVSWSDAQTCQLANGTCSVSIGVFQTGYDSPPPVRATYAGDDGYLPGSAEDQVDVLATPTTAAMSCDHASPAPGSLLHCSLTLTSPLGTPVPVSPLDAIYVTTTEGTVTCDVPASDGCGSTNTDTSTVSGFSVQLDQSTGPQLLVGEYTGDSFDLVAGATAGFSWVVPSPAVVQPQPAPVTTAPPVTPTATATATSISCVGPVSYKHATQCVVAVHAGTTPVTTGSVTVSPAAGSPAFPSASCLLSDEGLCTVAVASQAVPGAAVSYTAAYSGTSGLAASAGTGSFTVHTVPTTASVRCAGTKVNPKAVVSCVATVVTRYGTPAAPPPVHPSQVTVSAHGDAIVYAGSRTAKSCHWTSTRTGLTCHFSVRVGSASGTRVVKVHYAGTTGTTHNAASVGQATFTVKKKK